MIVDVNLSAICELEASIIFHRHDAFLIVLNMISAFDEHLGFFFSESLLTRWNLLLLDSLLHDLIPPFLQVVKFLVTHAKTRNFIWLQRLIQKSSWE